MCAMTGAALRLNLLQVTGFVSPRGDLFCGVSGGFGEPDGIRRILRLPETRHFVERIREFRSVRGIIVRRISNCADKRRHRFHQWFVVSFILAERHQAEPCNRNSDEERLTHGRSIYHFAFTWF